MRVLSVAKTVGGPGSMGFLIVGAAVGLFLLYVWPRHRPLGRAWLVTLVVMYLVLSLPVVATSIERGLPGWLTADPAIPGRLDSLVVLDGDNADARAVEAARLYARWSPSSVLVLGSADLLEATVAAGVPRERLTIDGRDRSTREQMGRVQMLAEGHRGAVAVVVSRLQAPRVAEIARSLGLDVIVVRAGVDVEPAVSGAWKLLPSTNALRVSRDAIYEHAALVYYRWRGWN